MSKEQATMEKESAYRLPTSVVPSRYIIELKPDLANFTFSGSESITVEIAHASKEILLNALDLTIDSVTAEQNGLVVPGVARLEASSERAVLSFNTELGAGQWQLNLQFGGEINDKLRGFYRSAQTLEGGEKSWIALTQFEATDARRAFPCFDEPAFKATFKLSLYLDKDLTALSNMSVEQECVDDYGKKKVIFKETMKMSTYIVAFVVGRLEASEAVMVDGVPMRIYAPLGKLHLTKFALAIGSAALNFFNKYYGIKYPGDKMDMIAVPDFAFGAMENLGAVIYRESALLVDVDQASHAELERVADVVAHELAHMWFGNLTTMKWWNGIWLNEAFATFMELVAVDSLKPQWKRWETFGVSRAMAFATDGLTATRAIEFPVHAPEEANGMFDVLTYEKGASVLRMLEQYIGAENFKSGVNNYLNKHKNANTETNDLWSALASASKEPVQEIMNSWIFQEGYPLVSAALVSENNQLELTQRRFLYLDGEAKELYQVPVLIKLKLKGENALLERRLLLSGKKATLSVDGAIEWAIVNAGGSGFYRVNYSDELLVGMKTLLSNSYANARPVEGLSALERFNLISDLWALTVNGTVKLADFLQLVRLFKEENDKNVWTVIVSALQYCHRVFHNNDQSSLKIKELARELLNPTYKRLGWEVMAGDDELTKQLRAIAILGLGTTGGDSAVQKQAADYYDKHLAGEALSPDVLSAVVTILAHTGDLKRYEQFEAMFKNGVSPQEQERYMYALGQFQQEDLLQRTMAKTLAGEVKGQNAPYLVRNIMLNPCGQQVGWKFIRNNWEQINKTFPSLIMTRLVEGVTGLIEPELAREVFAFFENYEFAGGQKTVDQHLEKLKVALVFLEKQKDF